MFFNLLFIMKKFRHKTLLWIAQERIDNKYRVFVKNGLEMDVVDWIPKELIENSQDREEIVEKDWITNARDEYWILNKRNTDTEQDFREAIEKHCPPLQKKFNKESFLDYHAESFNKWNFTTRPDVVNNFLRVNWLLEE